MNWTPSQSQVPTVIDLTDDETPGSALAFGGPVADPEERRVIFAALDSFYQYRKNAHYNTTHRRRQNFYALPQAQWKMLSEPPFSILDTFSAVDDCIDNNADLADTILDTGLQSFSLPSNPPKDTPQYWQNHATPNDMSKAHSTLRQVYRDWSAEGFEAEARPLLDAILSDLTQHLPPQTHHNHLPTLLLPGAGLARLLFSLTLHGYNVEGNEISYHQLLASNFILNHTLHAHQFTIHPFCTTFTNTPSRAAQLRAYQIPDLHPATTIAEHVKQGKTVGKMNMTGGDFITSYSDAVIEGRFDVVVTVYFIDTAPNLIRYIETVRNCLGQSGLWVNIGPLLWHFDDRAPKSFDSAHANEDDDTSMRDGRGELATERDTAVGDTGIGEPGSFELTNEEVLLLVEKMGFKIEHDEVLPESFGGGGYIQDPESLLQSRYRVCHWVARKL